MKKHRLRRFIKTKIVFHALAMSAVAHAAPAMQLSSLPKNLQNEVVGIEKSNPDINPQALLTGMIAYEHAQHLGLVKKPLLTLVDFTKPSSEKRFWVIDVAHATVDTEALVAHGRESGDNYATHFSDSLSANASSLGVYLTGQPYYGKHGYSMRLYGLDKGFNDTVFQRAVVMHSAWYVSEDMIRKYGRLGRSEGCFALNDAVEPGIVKNIQNGSILVAYADDSAWLSHSKFLS